LYVQLCFQPTHVLTAAPEYIESTNSADDSVVLSYFHKQSAERGVVSICVSRLLLFTALVEASYSEKTIDGSSLFSHPLALVISDAFVECKLWACSSLPQRSPKYANEAHDDVVRVFRTSSMLFKETKLKFSLIK
jgi:hypothetical protein